MKIQERERWVYKKGKFEEGSPAKFNIDGPELLKWMRSIAKIPGFGIEELPVCIKPESSTAIGRFMDMNTLKNGCKICVYVVREWGLYRQWINVDSKMFSNDGSATQLTAISLDRLMASIMKYKEVKRIADDEGTYAIEDFYSRYVKAAEKGTTGTNDPLKSYLLNEFRIKLSENYTLEELKKAFAETAAPQIINENLLWDNEDDYARLRTNVNFKTK